MIATTSGKHDVTNKATLNNFITHVHAHVHKETKSTSHAWAYTGTREKLFFGHILYGVSALWAWASTRDTHNVGTHTHT